MRLRNRNVLYEDLPPKSRMRIEERRVRFTKNASVTS